MRMRKVFLILLLCSSVVFFGIKVLFAQIEHHRQGQEADKPDYGFCSVGGGAKAVGEYSYVYKNKTYYFCSEACLRQFMSNPEEYLPRIKELKLEAYQYGFSPDPLVVKKGDIIKLDVTSRDVPHGIYIKEYGINVTVKKDETQKIEFLANKEGKFDILCSVYCGTGHSRMKGVLVVEPDEALRR